MGKMFLRSEVRQAVRAYIKPPYRPPSSSERLEEAVGVRGPVYKWRPGLLEIRVRKVRGRVYLETGLPIWLGDTTKLAAAVRDLIAGRSVATGFTLRPKRRD